MHRHQRVFMQAGGVQIFGIEIVRVAAICCADRTAEHPEDADVAVRRVRVQQRHDGVRAHFGRLRQSEQIQERRHQVHRLRERIAMFAGVASEIRMVDDQRNVRNFRVVRLQVFAPPIVFGEQEAVVGGEDQRGVAP